MADNSLEIRTRVRMAQWQSIIKECKESGMTVAFSKDVFMFCGRRKDRIKALFWDGDGFSLLYKRLDNGKFCWPKSTNEVISISEQQLRWLMEGLEICQPKSIKMSQPKSII